MAETREFRFTKKHIVIGSIIALCMLLINIAIPIIAGIEEKGRLTEILTTHGRDIEELKTKVETLYRIEARQDELVFNMKVLMRELDIKYVTTQADGEARGTK